MLGFFSRKPLSLMVKTMVSGEDFPFNQSHETMKCAIPRAALTVLRLVYLFEALGGAEKKPSRPRDPGPPQTKPGCFSQGFSHILGTMN